MSQNEEVREAIRQSYASIAMNNSQSGCCKSSCCGSASEDLVKVSLDVGYTEAELSDVPAGANMGLGCGNPTAIAALKEGETVLDLGSGGGFDCFLARRKVGETGYVIGVDMTSDMIKLARINNEKSGYTNVEFRLGEIEHLPVANNSIDVIISNCVINLSMDKDQVFKETYRVLKAGGRLSISDIVAIAEMPEHIKNDISMMSCCIGGAEHIDNLRLMLENAGFKNVSMRPNKKESNRVPGVEEYVASYIIEATKGNGCCCKSSDCCR